jgi:metallophosphoesterase (TIGR00282 family)
MNILYIGDIMGEPGIRVVEKLLPEIRREYSVDVVIAQAENTTEGKGIGVADFGRLRKLGIDGFTGGNWTMHLEEIYPALNDPAQPIVRPANYPAGTPGQGFKYIDTPKGKVLIISLLGQIVGRDADKPTDNPLLVIDAVLESQKGVNKVATVINFHGDFSSEKFVIGRYLDGRAADSGGPVSLVIGDHWHVPTADAMVLPGGTAHITDVGMCGTLDSCLGVKLEVIMERWKTGASSRNVLEDGGRLQLCAVVATVDESTGKANTIQQIRRIVD